MTPGTTDSTDLFLASASPRRRELLARMGLCCALLPQDIDESLTPGETAAGYVQRLAAAKAAAALEDGAYRAPVPVVAADTAVVCEGRVLGKPASLTESMSMLGLLSGRCHQVMTAVTVADPERSASTLVISQVCFRVISEEEMRAYWHTGEPCDKAGSYGIQGLGAMFVSGIKGSYSGVVGLPLFETLELLAGFGISSLALLARNDWSAAR